MDRKAKEVVVVVIIIILLRVASLHKSWMESFLKSSGDNESVVCSFVQFKITFKTKYISVHLKTKVFVPNIQKS